MTIIEIAAHAATVMSAAFQAHRCRENKLKVISFSVLWIISTNWLPLCIFEFHKNFMITIRRSYHTTTTGSETVFYRRLLHPLSVTSLQTKHRSNVLQKLFKALKQTTVTEALFGTPYSSSSSSSSPILAINK
ncbi:hypothetical protein T4A_13258 [Trichinella pseudospiralis]|uniref:Uncharacterized protein n=1 Tax=Trichinella pseudospiralis TaxID=6337 RepID=A0A0V1ETC0_TRIPS|nr:hypothetical protein T4A_13258 [Trichinella pseudospiralis]